MKDPDQTAIPEPTVWLEILAPVLDWYQSDEHPEREPLDILRDIVADLQSDRADALAGAAEMSRQRTALDDLCQWLATEAFVDQCARLAAEHDWKKERYHAGRSEACTQVLSKVRDIFGPSGQARP